MSEREAGKGRELYTPEEEAIFEAVHKALVEYDRAKRTARDLRMISRGEGPTIKRGTGRVAQALHVTRAVAAALHDPNDDRVAAPTPTGGG